MKVFLRGKLWWGHWSVDGRRYRVSSGTSDEKLAKEILAKKYAECFREKTQGVVARKTWAEATARYLREHQHLKSIAMYESESAWWTQQFERRKIVYLDQITPEEVRRIRDEYFASQKQRRFKQTSRKPGAINRSIAYLRAVVNAAYREYRWFPYSSTPPLFRMLPGEQSRIRYITPEEFERLVQYLPVTHGRAARLAVATGMRRSNVLGLRWDQVDMENRVAHIEGVLMKNGQPLVIPLNDAAMSVIALQQNSTPWVFPSPTHHKPIGPIVHALWVRACEKAGISDFHWHDLRHTFASWLRQSGAELDVIQQLGGWKNSDMVQRYAHLSLEHLRGAASMVDVKLNQGKPLNDTNLTQFPPRPHLRLVS